MISVVQQTEEQVPSSGGRDMSQAREKMEQKWKAIGVAYVMMKPDEPIEIRLLYETHVCQAVKDALAERFGVGAVPWQVCGGVEEK